MPRQHAPATPPICVKEKKTKKAAPNATQTHFCAPEPTSRNRIAAGTRNRMKYANVLKIMHPTSSPFSRTTVSSNEDFCPSRRRPRLAILSYLLILPCLTRHPSFVSRGPALDLRMAVNFRPIINKLHPTQTHPKTSPCAL